jgi:YD repeat-containing protein
MVAIVGGNNLGLNLGSLALLGANGRIGNAVQGRSGERAYVNVANGNLVLQDNDALLAGLGLDVDDLRTYNSQGAANFTNGDGWQGGLYKSVSAASDGALQRTDSDGSVSTYAWSATAQAYLQADGSGGVLNSIRANADGTWTWTNGGTGATETYRGSGAGLLLSSSDASGNTLTYGYNAQNQLVQVTDADGESLNFSYDGENLASLSLTLQSGQTERLVDYTYDSLNRLTSVTVNLDPDGTVPAGLDTLSSYVTTYGYDGDSDRVASVMQSDGTSLSIAYVQAGGVYRVASVTDGDGETTQYAYDVDAQTTTVTDPSDVVSTYRYDSDGRLTQVSTGVTAGNPNGLTQLSYTYDGLGNVTSVTDGMGDIVTYTYDADGNQIGLVDGAGDTITRTYDAQNQLQTETVYAQAAGFGAQASEPAVTHYVYDAGGHNLLRYVISPEGRVTEYRYDANGRRIATIQYSQQTYDTSGLAADAVPTEAQMQTWGQQQDQTTLERTDYTYDFRGQLQSATTYGAVDSNGNGAASGASTTLYVYSQSGELLQAISPDGQTVTQNVYDGLGRVVSQTTRSADGATSVTTLTQYDDANGRTTVTQANGLATVSTYDAAGRLVSVIQNDASGDQVGTTRYAYDAAGRLLMTTGPTGTSAWSLYDGAGRKVADIDPTGQLTEYVYNADNQVTETIVYATLVAVSSLVDANGQPAAVTLDQIRPASSAQDEKSWDFYDAAGRLAWNVDGQGNVTRTVYDGESRVVSVTRLATPVDTSLLGNGVGVALDLPGQATTTTLSEVTPGGSQNGYVLRAAVQGSAPSGTVSFFSGQTFLGSGTVVDGVATFALTSLPAGGAALTAAYGGDANNLGSTSSGVAVTAAPPGSPTPSATVLTLSPSSASTADAVVLTALVLGRDPSGTVSFFNGMALLGTATVVNGTASLALAGLPEGDNALTAAYGGDSANVASESTLVNETVTAAPVFQPTTVSLSASPSLVTALQPVTLTATVTGNAPSGTVSFFDGQTLVGSSTVVDGQASLTVTTLAIGSDDLTAVYSGDTQNAGSVSGQVTQVVTGQNPGLDLFFPNTPPSAGEPLMLVAHVGMELYETGNYSISFPPTGTVTFYDGNTVLGTAQLGKDSSGEYGLAMLTVPGLPAGQAQITAVYSGDASFVGVQTQQQLTVSQVSPSLSLNTSQSGSSTTLTATLSGGYGIEMTGLMTFMSGTTVLGTAQVVDGQASMTLTNVPAGTYAWSATYSGDANNATSVATVNATGTALSAPSFGGSDTQVSLSSSSSSVAALQPVTLTATVTGNPPSGTVSFFSGQTLVGSAVVVDGQASLTITTLPIGTDQLTAVYSGDTQNASSVSGQMAQVVTGYTPSMELDLSNYAPIVGQPLTLNAHVVGVSNDSNGVSPTGTVTFYDGATVLGTATLGPDSQPRGASSSLATLTTAGLPAGQSQIIAVYNGDASYISIQAPQQLNVSQASTSLSLGTSQSGSSTTLTATLNGGYEPTGFVTFMSGTTVLGAAQLVSGQASLTLANVPAGTYAVSASYTGDVSNAASAASINAAGAALPAQASGASSTQVSLTSSSSSVTALEPVTLTATVTGNAPSGTVSFFNGQTLLGSSTVVDGQASLTVKTLPTGSDQLTAVYSGDTQNASSLSGQVAQVVTGQTLPLVLGGMVSATVGEGMTIFAQLGVAVTHSPPTGTVTFYDNDTVLGTATLVRNSRGGRATLNIVGLPVGQTEIRAVYSGDAAFISVQNQTQVNVSQASPSLSLNASKSGSYTTLNAMLSGGYQPTGLVTFMNGMTVLGTARVVDGQASLTLAALPSGAVELTASYSGDASNATADAQIQQTVTSAVSTTTIGIIGARNGSPLFVEANVAGDNPGGTVTFYSGSTAIGTAELVNGIAAIAVLGGSANAGPMTAVYSGDGNNTGSTSAPLSTKANVVLAPIPSTAGGAAVTLSAQVTGYDPTGQVTFVSGTTVLGTADVVDGTATLVVRGLGLPAGTDGVTAYYLGDAMNGAASAEQPMTAEAGPRTVVVATAAADRTTTRIYNDDGLVTATIDGDGYLTRYVYNGAGQQTGTIAYANPVPGFNDAAHFAAAVATAQATDSLTGLLPASSAADISTYDFYNARGLLVGQVDGDGYLTETVYDADGHVTQTIRYATPVEGPVDAGATLAHVRPASSPGDQTTSTTWDALGRVSTQTNSEGTVTRYAYDSMGNVIEATTALGTADQRTVMTRYDALGRVIAELSGDGAALITGDQTQEQIDAIWNQYALTYTYDAAGRRLSATDANGNRTVYFYDDAGRLRFTVNADGDATEDSYDALGHLTSKTQYATALSGSALSALQGGLLSSASNQAAVTTLQNARNANAQENSVTQYAYDDVGELIQTTDALGGVATTRYDAFGDAVQTTDTIAAGHTATSTASYDNRGLQTGTISDLGGIAATTNVQYDAFGRVVATTDANGNVTTSSYDALGRVIATTDAAGSTRSSTYDAFGRVLTQTDALGNTTAYSYDASARTVTTTTPDGVSVTVKHNREGQTLSVTDGNGNTTAYTYDANGNLLSTATPLATTTDRYDAGDRLISSTDANGIATHYTYDAANRLLSRTVDPGGLNLTTRYAYDAKGGQISVTDPNGVVTQNTFDLDGELLTQTVDPGGLALTTRYSYDEAGHVVTVTNPGGTVTQYTYDDLGRRVMTQVDPSGLDLTTQYAYDAHGNMVSSTDGAGNVTRYTFDADNRIVYQVNGAGDVQFTQYDADGRVARTIAYATPIDPSRLGSAPASAQIAALVQPHAGSDVSQSNVYDGDGRLSYTVDGVGGVVHYVYDGDGNVIERIQYANRVSGYTGGVPQVVADSAHDTDVRTVYDAQNRAIFTIDGTGAVTQQVYDGNGNVLAKLAYATPVPVSTPATAAALSAAVGGIANPSRDESVRQVFDAANRVVWSVNGVGAVTHYTYDGDGNVTSKIGYATALVAGADPSTVSASAQDQETDWVYDAAGRVIYQLQVTDHADGVVPGASGMRAVTSYQYDANGNRIRTVEFETPLPASVSVDAQSIYAHLVVMPAFDRVQTAAYDAAGRLVYSQDAGGSITQYTYDGASRLISTTQYARWGAVDESFEGSADGAHGFEATTPNAATFAQLAIATSGQDRTTQYVYDGAGRQIYQIDALGYVTQTDYDGVGRAVNSILYAKAVSVDAHGNPALVAAAIVADSSADETTSSAFDAADNLVTVTDALGHAQQYVYNGVGEKLAYTNQNGATWTYDYDAAGRVVSETSPAVDVTTVAQDANGNLVQTGTSAVNVVTMMSYDALGNLTSRTEAAGTAQARTTQYVYDALGRQIETIFPPVGVYNPSADTLNVNGEGSTATRTETTQTLYSQVFYDTLGNAVADRDVSGNYTYKTYDRTGQLRYDVDALGYVTAYQRDVFGDQVGLTRYALPVSTASWGTTPPTDAAMASLMMTLGADARTISASYDQLGRAARVDQPYAWSDDGAGHSGMANEITLYTYDAFGNVVRTQTLTALNQWATNRYYYDLRGQQVASVDALGYVTTQQFDAAGNLVAQTQYANATDGELASGYPTAPASSQDRETTYGYDQANRKVSQTQVGVTYSTASDGSSVVGNLTTTYDYDALGNLTRTTDALGSSTYTYYDALGRTIATAAPSVSDTTGGQALIPLTTYALDAFGNIVVKTQYANGAGWAGQAGYAVAGGSSADRTTLTAYDRHGNAIETTDADGNSQFMSYTAAGQLAKDWQSVRGNDGVVHTLYTVYQYDALGRQTAIITPNSNSIVSGGAIATESQTQAGSLTTAMVYDAFGEMIQRGSYVTGGTPQYQEYFDYDSAGRLWRTNSGDGTVHVFLYNVQGDKTGDITSAGSAGGSAAGVDLSQAASAKAVDQMPANALRRTSMQLDLLGRTIVETLPQRQDSTDAQLYSPRVYQTFDRWGNVLSQSNPDNSAWITYYSYNWNNQVIQRIQPDGNGQESAGSPITQMYYDALGRQVAIRDADGNVNGQAWDADGRLRNEVHADGGVVTHEYDAFGDQMRLIDADGNVTDYGYDKMGRNTSITYEGVGVYTSNGQSVSGGVQKLTTYSTYDAAGRKLTQTDGTGAATRYTYDLVGNQIATTDADGYTSRAAYNAQGKQIGSQDADGALATWRYDYFGELMGHTDIGGASYAFTYDNARQLLSQTNTRGQSLSYTYDAAGQVIEINDAALNQQTYYSYNAAGQHVLEQTVQAGVTYQNQTLGYDALGRLSIVNAMNGVSVQTDYDKVGNKMHEHITYNSLQAHTVIDYGNVQSVDESGNPIYQQVQTGTQQVQTGTQQVQTGTQTVQTGTQQVQTGTQQVQTGTDESGAPIYTTEPVYTTVPVYSTVPVYTSVPVYTTEPVYTEEPVYHVAPIGSHVEYNTIGHVQDLFFAYDSMNRQILVDGGIDNSANNLANVTPGQGHILAYDHNGNRIEDRSWGTQVTPEYVQNYDESGTALGAPQLVGYQSQTGIQTTWYRYDNMNRLSTVATGAYGQVQTGVQQTGVDESGQPIYQAVYTTEALGQAQAIVLDTRLYDGASRLVQSGPAGSLPAAYVKALTDGNLNISGATTTVSRYDADGRLLSQAVTNEADPSSSTTTQYTAYDAAGNLEAYQTTQGVNGDTIVTNTTVTFGRYDGYVETLQSSVSTNESSGNQTTGTTTEGYDANGRLISVVDSATSSNSRTLVNDAQGHVLDKNQQGELHELVADGQVIGIYGQTIDSRTPTQADGSPNYDAVGNFDLAYEPVTNSYPAAATGQYPVQAGDTLQSIALAAYGDSSLWYLIADANGLKGNADLKVGQVLNIPTRVGDVHNNAQTYAPYDASRIVGSTAPQLPVPAGNQDSGGGGCGPIGEIIMVVVAVVATVVTYGAAAPEMGSLLGGEVAGDVAAGAIAGAAGSVASQAVGNAIGAEDGFNWGAVGMGAIGGAVTGGLGASGLGSAVGGGVTGAVVDATAGSLISQGADVALGLQQHFDWAAVAAAAVGAGVTAGADVEMNYNPQQNFDFGKSFAAAAAGSVASGVTGAALDGGHISVGQIAADAFGNALGQSLGQDYLESNRNTGGNLFAVRTQNQINVGNSGDAVLFGPNGGTTNGWGTQAGMASGYGLTTGASAAEGPDSVFDGYTQQTTGALDNQILPGGLGGVGSGFVAPYSSDTALFGVDGMPGELNGMVAAAGSLAYVASNVATPYSGAALLYGPNYGASMASPLGQIDGFEYAPGEPSGSGVPVAGGDSSALLDAWNIAKRWGGEAGQSLLGFGESVVNGVNANVNGMFQLGHSVMVAGERSGFLPPGASNVTVPQFPLFNVPPTLTKQIGAGLGFASTMLLSLGEASPTGPSPSPVIATESVPSLTGVPINGATRTVPLGFTPETQFTAAAQDLQNALTQSGITDATIGVRGSSVTGYSLTKGTQFGPQSDIDFFIESGQLTDGYSTSRNIPGFVHPNKILPDYPLLQDWSTNWTNILGRDVTPGAFVPGTLPVQPSIVVKPIVPGG